MIRKQLRDTLSADFFSPSSRLRISFTVEGEMQKCVNITPAPENGYPWRNFCRTDPNIDMGRSGRESSSQDKWPLLDFLIHLLTVEPDKAESWKFICNPAVIFLLPHPLRKNYLTTTLSSTSSMTGWWDQVTIQWKDSQLSEHEMNMFWFLFWSCDLSGTYYRSI
jgi:hypothetical protein